MISAVTSEDIPPVLLMADQSDEAVASRAAEDITGTTIGRFAVRARVGSGGMGEVYLAEDARLKRAVALKRLAPQLSADPRYHQRFLKEGERASALNHPHIASVYDVLEEKSGLFLVMEYVEGATLRERIGKPLPFDEFLVTAIQCAEALAAAHDQGILHGDIKPENIMLTPSNNVKVLDFGVARRMPLDDEVATESVSDTTSVAGTPAYMAPEVLLQKPADPRADIFALGVVFYEMLTGRHPFRASGLAATTDRILHETPDPVTAVNPDVSPAAGRLVEKMIAKEPAERYGSAQDLLADLRRLRRGEPIGRGGSRAFARYVQRRGKAAGLAALLLAALVVALLFWQRIRAPKVGPIPEEKNLAVLPFVAIGGDREAAAFADGLTETLTTRLTQLTERRSLQVVPANAIHELGPVTASQVRDILGASLVLEGYLQQSAGKVRIDYSLVDANTGRQLVADSITSQASDPFAVEDRVVTSVLQNLRIQLNAAERQAFGSRGTSRPAAYDDYLRGRGYLQNYHDPENVQKAIGLFNRAIGLDANDGLAYAGLGEAYWHRYMETQNAAWIAQATEACQKAVELKRDLAGGYTCLGTVYTGTGRYEDAVREFQQAVSLEPTSDGAFRGLAAAYSHLGQPAEAEETFRRAITLRPQYWAGYSWLGAFYFNQGRYTEAADMFGHVVALAPGGYRGYSNLGGAYLALGRYADAIQMFRRSVGIRPTADASSNLGASYFLLRRFTEAAQAYEEALKLDQKNYEIWWNLAEAYYEVPGKGERAATACRRAAELAGQALKVNPRDATALSFLAVFRAMLGERDAALTSLKRALAADARDSEVRFNAALVYNQLRETDQALDWLAKALAAGYPQTVARDTPSLDNLRGNPRFREILFPTK